MKQKKLSRKIDSAPENNAEAMEIYKQYTIDSHSEDFNGIEFCLFADNSDKPIVMMIDGWSYSQSRGRVHTYKLGLNFKEGFYEAIQTRPNRIILCAHSGVEDEFPKLGVLKDTLEIPFNTEPIANFKADCNDISYIHATITRILPKEASMDYSFIESIWQDGDNRHCVEYLLYKKEDDVILLVGVNRKVILMPKLEDEYIKGGMRIKVIDDIPFP